MTKKLPRTSQRTLDDLRKAASGALDADRRSLRAVSSEAAPDASSEPGAASPRKPDAGTGASETAASAAAREGEAGAQDHGKHNRNEAGSADTGRSPHRRVTRVPPERPDPEAFRLASAKLIVERHSNLAGFAGLLPMPWVDLATITLATERMLRKLARLYGEPLDRRRSMRLATAMITGMAAPGIASFATTGLLRMTPGPNLFGTLATSLSAAILVRVVGEVYLAHLTGTDAVGGLPGTHARA